jgi:hypothetical protein
MKKMNVLLVDADSKKGFPNLVLMKESAWYKSQGYLVDLVKGIPTTKPLEHYDKVLISCIFYQNKDAVLDYASQFDNAVVGGSGVDLELNLDHDIEHIMPDYSLYDIDYSLGFTSRGCIRNCGFCIVPEKEGVIRDNAPITEFLHPEHKKIVLLDNNFQSSPRWRENLDCIKEHNLKVNFNQGLDIRLMTKEFAEALAQVKYYPHSFKKKGLHFAFDDLRTEKAVRKGVAILETAGIPAKHLMFYVLVGYNSTFDQDMKRVDILRELGTKPYIMRYNQIKTPELNRLSRWINRMYYEFIPWSDYR